jgi:hypothetical protein
VSANLPQPRRRRQLAAAKAEIEQEANKAREELRGQVSAIAIASAEKILNREIDSKAVADNNTVARPYAQAAFEVAQENDALAELSESFAAAKALLSDGQVAAFLAAPALTDEERLSFLQDLFAKVVFGVCRWQQARYELPQAAA